ncbi:MAG: type II secretion system F family protein [Candidatus Aenigmarchaeota archaeon]|nr:type II secretion system F family protein [Candidatus Aenigmarchaeota archaeon]
MVSYVSVSHKFFGGLSRYLKGYFLDIQDDLQMANIPYTLEEYLSVAVFTTAATLLIEAALFGFIFGLLNFSIIVNMLLSFTLAATVSGLLFFLFYSYPITKAKTRGNKIKKLLPFAVAYLAAMSSSKLPPITMFKTLSQFKEYGTVSEEANNVVQDVEAFGMNFSTALKRQAKRTPSAELRELIWGINTVSSSGGDLTSYLSQKSNEYMNDYKRKIRKYSQDLSLFVEMYLTLVISGAIFFIVLSSVVSSISGDITTIIIQTFVVFILLPLISLGFIVLVKSISPLE